jgi:hypothetical protein
MRAWTLFSAVAIFFAGCQYDPFTAVYTTKQPKAEDLVGAYLPTEDTKKLITSQGHYPTIESAIVLSADGTVTMTNIPDWWQTPFGEPQGKFNSRRGNWTVQKHQEWWAVGLHLDPDFGTDLLLIGEKPPYTIHLIIGDPDQGRGMDFIRSKI